MAKSPCYKCEREIKRVGCHGICKDYADFVELNEKEKEWLNEKKGDVISKVDFSYKDYRRQGYPKKSRTRRRHG